ncbi:glutathione S-transferase family protein [Xinfangfangia sp. D13-10-4-6]|uniref:glutathione S-transferase N-terminal domain-containing protein n=1 Tax=Pseudogemmobacter hezensis TaxID=2737662 RepID=UPI001555D06D|nr:glutathione S-transferase N-terminal domain-containing protein [Pseudogemmobacter hezensis]NPD16910.1 glutathione S-transferase family protein [Pseudogemmobacter hezensis]
MTAPITLYYWPTPNGHKISVALEELDLPYEVSLVDIGRGAQFEPAFLQIAPNNRIPALTDRDGPDGQPVSLFESGAILQYLARKTGRLYGEGARGQIEVEQWLMWQMGGVGPMAGQANHFLRYAPEMDPPQILPYAQDRYRREVGRLYGVLDRRLADRPFVAGEALSIADIAIWAWARAWKKQQQDISDKPHFSAWLDRLSARPAFIKGVALAAEARQAKLDKTAIENLYKR